MVHTVDRVAHPRLAEAVDAAPREPSRTDRVFEIGLGALIGGLQATLADQVGPPSTKH